VHLRSASCQKAAPKEAAGSQVRSSEREEKEVEKEEEGVNGERVRASFFSPSRFFTKKGFNK
jgi:hypothetical protein